MKNLVLSSAVAVAATLAAGSAAAATYTFDFTGSGSQVGTPDIFDVSAGYVSPFGIGTSVVTENEAGLGVQTRALGEGSGSSGAGTIDGNPLLTSEFLTVEFDGLVDLASFTLGLWDGNDDFSYLIQTLTGPVLGFGTSPTATLNLEDVSSFTIFAVGLPLVDGFVRGNDEFTLAGFTVSVDDTAAVPLPAAAGLLLGGLGLLGLARRRRAA